jgi:hypothetical protein
MVTRYFFLGVKTGARRFSALLADSVNLVLLFLVYFLGVGVTSIIARVFSKKFLDMGSTQESCKTYWRTVSPSKETDKSYFYRQF